MTRNVAKPLRTNQKRIFAALRLCMTEFESIFKR